MQITRSDGQHIDACLGIARQLPEYFNESGMAAMSRDLHEHRLYVALESDACLGFAAVKPKSGVVAEVTWMAVTPTLKNQGIGSLLMNHVANELKLAGFKLLEVKTLSADVEYAPYERTRRFYEKSRFTLLETIDPYPAWEPGNPCAIYVRVL